MIPAKGVIHLAEAVMMVERPERKTGPELLTSQQVAERLAVSVRTLWRLVAAGKFPQPVRYNRKLVRWKSADVTRYIDSLS
jgi:excisionase family DNA binding protein